MNRNSYLKLTLGLLAAAFTMLSASTSQAMPTFFQHVDVNTSSLTGSSSAPFYLDFQFNDGGLPNNNTATISNFSYSSGSATDTSTTLGGALGDIGSTVTFNNSSAYQELYQTFSPGTTHISFDVHLTTNSDSLTPDAFVFAILDKTQANITTTGPADQLLQVDLSASPTVYPYSGRGDFSGVTASSVPEPNSAGMLALGVCLVVLFSRNQQSAVRH